MKNAPEVDGLEWRIRRALHAQATRYVPTVGRRSARAAEETQALASKPRRIALVGASLVCVVVLAVGVWIASRGPGSDVSSRLSPSTLTVRDVYQRVSRALDRPGHVYNQTSVWTDDRDPSASQTIDLWVDVSRGATREELATPPVAWLTTGSVEYVKTKQNSGARAPAESCHGVSTSVAKVLGCPLQSKTVRSAQSVESSTVQGRRSVVLVTNIESVRGETFRALGHLYLDARTLLPFAATSTQTNGDGANRTRTKIEGTVRHEFVLAESLPADFFTTASIDAWVAAHP